MMVRCAHVRAVPIAAAALLILAGCGKNVEPVPPEEVVDHYREVAEDTIEALRPVTADGAQWDGGATALQEPAPGSCTYWAGQWSAGGWSGEPLYPEHEDGTWDWETTAGAVNPTIAEHGFDELSDPRQEGGITSLISTDDHGATLSINNRGDIEISGAALTGEGC